jgi:hypothetical protein
MDINTKLVELLTEALSLLTEDSKPDARDSVPQPGSNPILGAVHPKDLWEAFKAAGGTEPVWNATCEALQIRDTSALGNDTAKFTSFKEVLNVQLEAED